jgi:hypothetical protein
MSVQPQLSPPWYTLWNEIKASVGNDPGVKVGPLVTSSLPYIVPITVGNHDKAVALASIMALQHQFGNISVVIQVKDGDGTPVKPINPTSADQLAELVKTALDSNGWLTQVVVQPLFPGGRAIVFAVFAKAVIQFFNDDLSDLYHNYNNVVGFVF